MRRIALTGGIATGKSYVRRRLQALGLPALDADALVHAMLGPGTAATSAVARRFGPAVLDAAGGVDRRALGRLVFGDPAARAGLEAILHPLVYEQVGQWLADREAAGAAAALADIPLLFETGREGDFDVVVVVACDPAEQVRRVMVRDGLGEADARARLGAQWPIADKVVRADHVIHTDGSFEDTDRQVDALYRRLA
ncbi:MAG: coaE [Acidobacteria bacterium]|nr:coaE [Acidobacteriota bacterium]